MIELSWILDPATGALVVEGLAVREASALAGDLLGPGQELTCARPLRDASLPARSTGSNTTLRIARIYHGSVVDGPGRRSVVQVQGCPLRCPGCFVPETHDPSNGVVLSVPDIVTAVLDPAGAPRDGVTILGGEPFAQPSGLASLLRALKACDLHTIVYSGYTLEALARRGEGSVHAALRLTDLLIDGPYVAALADGAGRWRGSRNQRLVSRPGQLLPARAAGGPAHEHDVALPANDL
jgi:anaerobic ribonucleoside-triphosphate reductase activating protein